MSITATQAVTRAIAGSGGAGAFSGSLTVTRSIDPFRAAFGGFLTISRALWVDSDLTLVLDGAPTGLTGVLTVEIVSFDGTVVVYGPSTAGIIETPAGTGRYTVAVASPPIGHYFVVWSNGSITARSELEIVDEAGAGGDTVQHVMHGDHWPDGTAVSVFPASAWTDHDRAPSGDFVTTGTVAEGSVTFFGLTPKVRYVAFADGVGVTFMPRVLISPEYTHASPGVERMDVIEQKLTTFGLTVPTFDSVSNEATTRANVDAALSARLDQLETASSGVTIETRLAALEAAVVALQQAVSAGALGAVWQ